MSVSCDELTIARPINEVSREVRIIGALYPRACLSVTGTIPCQSSRLYHNTGVQTLPPPNGDTYKLVYGRDPSASDYTRNMGVAAIGRYTEDPRLNPFELIYGSAYVARHIEEKATYVDSGFQTADYQISNMSIARAKVKASLTANKYRDIADRAGLAVSAETKDESIIHSEQHRTLLQFGSDGNLLNGSVEGRFLPNISGRTVHPSSYARTSSAVCMEQAPSFARYQSPFTPRREALQVVPSQFPTNMPQALPEHTGKIFRAISSLAPASEEDVLDFGLAMDDEHGSVGPDTEAFIVCYADDLRTSSRHGLSVSDKLSPRKRRPRDECDTELEPERAKRSAHKERHEPITTVALPTDLPTCSPQQGLMGTDRSSVAKRHKISRTLHRSGFKSVERTQEHTLSDRPSQTTTRIEKTTPNSLDNPQKQGRRSSFTLNPMEKTGPGFLRDRFNISQLAAHTNAPNQRGFQENDAKSYLIANAQRLPRPLIDREAQDPNLSTRHSSSSPRKRSHSLSCHGDSLSRPNKKQIRAVSSIARQSCDSSRRESGPETLRKESSDHKESQTIGQQPMASKSAATRLDHKVAGRVREVAKSRISRTPKRPLTPYVPPAMRDRKRPDLEEGRRKKTHRIR